MRFFSPELPRYWVELMLMCQREMTTQNGEVLVANKKEGLLEWGLIWFWCLVRTFFAYIL